MVGGIALNLHGVPRTTADLDLMVVLENKNLKHLTVGDIFDSVETTQKKFTELIRPLPLLPTVVVWCLTIPTEYALLSWEQKKQNKA